MGQSIDRRGIDQVIEGYKMYHDQSSCAYYSVWQGSVLKFAHMDNNIDDGLKMLEDNLNYIEISQSQAVYTLKVHKETDKDNLIGSKTPYYGSFNFLVYDQHGMAQQGRGVRDESYMARMIQEMRDEIAELKAEKEDGISGIEPQQQFIMKIIQEPIVQQLGGFLVDYLSGRNRNTQQPYARPPQQQQRPAMSGIDRDMAADDISLAKSINRIYAIDPTFPDVLERIADLAENDPQKYQFAKTML